MSDEETTAAVAHLIMAAAKVGNDMKAITLPATGETRVFISLEVADELHEALLRLQGCIVENGPTMGVVVGETDGEEAEPNPYGRFMMLEPMDA